MQAVALCISLAILHLMTETEAEPRTFQVTVTPAGLTMALPDGCLYLPPPTSQAIFTTYKRQWAKFLRGMHPEADRGFPPRLAVFVDWFELRDLHIAAFEYEFCA